MSAYKKLKKKDSFLTSYTSHKDYVISSSAHQKVFDLATYVAVSGSSTFFPSTSPTEPAAGAFPPTHFTDLTYNSIKHLYYSNFNDLGHPATSSYEPSGSLSGSYYENYMQSYYRKNVRRAQDRFTIMSIPRKHFGVHIKPGSVLLKPNTTDLATTYVANNYVAQEYVEDGDEAYGSDSGTPTSGTTVVGPENKYYNPSRSEFDAIRNLNGFNSALIDDGDGNLIISSSADMDPLYKNVVVGNIIYPHGLIIITNPVVANYYAYYFDGEIRWSSSHPIYTYNYNCLIRENEFNFTQHPSAIKNDTTGSIADNVTGSYFQPYFTSVGLYNEANELIAVAKMGQPIPVSDNTEMTVKIKLDI